MNFTLGYIAGVATVVVVFLILAFFRAGIERRIQIIEKNLYNVGPRPKGMVILPDDEATVARNEIIERNRKEGKDTPLKDLM